MKILVTPLDWGLGHATRLVPVIKWLIENNHDVIIAGSGNSLEVLKRNFPNIKTLTLQSFSPWYNARLGVASSILLQIPKFLFCYYREFLTTKRIVKRHGIDTIISDNRYGVYSKKSKSYIITHQLTPKCGIKILEPLEPLLARLLARWVNKFDECFIPDISPYPNGLSGELSNPQYIKIPYRYIGVLSRLRPAVGKTSDTDTIEWLGIISGQEPHRTIFEKEVIKLFKTKNGRCVIVCGKIGNEHPSKDGQIEIYPYLGIEELSFFMQNARNIVCRSGYSTIMDLYRMKKRAYLSATPQQAEQEYLAELLNKKYGFEKLNLHL